ncbi:MAG: hypothetical protein H6757_00005 [Candidatus Omnitrophica bacterium]|nr:hypothetical protein [Candidatus Omnitrophota bacterium]
MSGQGFMIQYQIEGRQVFIQIKNQICDTPEELISSRLFAEILKRAVDELQNKDGRLLSIFGRGAIKEENLKTLTEVLKYLTKMPVDMVAKVVGQSKSFMKDKVLLNDFVEYLYNYWRSFTRFIICDSEGDKFDKRPFRTFNYTVENLTRLVRQTYRDIQENIMGSHPSIYRQVHAGAEAAVIALPKPVPYTGQYKILGSISLIRQLFFYPPLVIESGVNKRTGQFERIEENPIDWIHPDKDDWIGYPLKSGNLLIVVYLRKCFFQMGVALSNLFEMATDEDLTRQPDAVYFCGVPAKQMKHIQKQRTVFYEDKKASMLVGAISDETDYDYFGYLKKMILTLHNVRKIEQGEMPFHGALVKIFLKSGKEASVLFIGDSGAGKSETLEALRAIGDRRVRDMVVIADDMGSLHLNANGDVLGYGTEIGAFVRMDDLHPGYAFGQIDRAIFMNAHVANARVILPVTNYAHVIQGVTIDYVLYANNYQHIDEDHPILENIAHVDDAWKIFREGAVMSKGTTETTGMTYTYFSNIFGPVQCKQQHDLVARKFFEAFFQKGIYVGQIRTRLGIPKWEQKGPQEAAASLLKLIQST